MSVPKALVESGKAPAVGKWYRLLKDYGEGPGALTATASYFALHGIHTEYGPRQVQVTHVLESGVHGVGESVSDTVVVAWYQRTSDGRVSQHHVQFAEGAFLELFGAGSVPAEYKVWLKQQGVVV